MSDGLSLARIQRLLSRTRTAFEPVQNTLRVRRMLINRDSAAYENNATGTLLPSPFEKTEIGLRVMIGEPSKVAQHYASRIAANRPDITVVPLTTRKDVSATLDKVSGEQERLDNQLWVENGGRAEQWTCGWAMGVGGAAYYVTMPRDLDFGLPDREYYGDLTDDEVRALRNEGKLGPSQVPHPRTGQLVYAEHGDVWAARRTSQAKARAISGRSLFTLRAYPRDMVLCERDADGLRWAAVVEEIPGSELGPGSTFALDLAKRSQDVPADDYSLFGIFTDDQGRIIGGVPKGGPVGTEHWQSANAYTLIKYFDREEFVILVAPQGTVEGAYEVWRCDHGCTIQGVPACPVEEVPFYRTDVDIPGREFATALDQVFALIPQLNQLLTLASNKAAFNGIPRWVVELHDGTTLRDADGEPQTIEQTAVPGLSPEEASAWPGTLKQLLIDEHNSLETGIELLLKRLSEVMPSPVTNGISGSSAAAWQVRQLIQQAQEDLRQPVDNHAAAVMKIVQRWHGWLRTLDVPVYFFAAPGARADKRSMRGLIEFDPSNLTDSIQVTQELDTPEEATVRVQQGLELLTGVEGHAVIDYREFFTDYKRSEDPRDAEIRMYVQMVVDHVMGGVPAQPGSLIQEVADGVRGAVHYELLQTSPNYALANARGQALMAQQQAQVGPAGAPGGEQGNVAQTAGIRQPGMGMAPTLEGQLGGVTTINRQMAQDRTLGGGGMQPGIGVGGR